MIRRLLVVDASVVRSAGETQHPMSSSCRNCLEAIRRICHRVAATPAIREEWKNHMSRFSRKWLRSMAARRKPLQSVAATPIDLDVAGLSKGDQEAIEKDRGLLEAAFSADRVIVTRDDALCSVLVKTPQGRKIKDAITWINPLADGVAELEKL